MAKRRTLTEAEIFRLSIKNWLGVGEVALMLQVSETTVKNLWTSGRLTYKCMPNRQRTRKSSIAMIKEYKKRQMKY